MPGIRNAKLGVVQTGSGIAQTADAIPSSAIHKWKFDEGSGTTAADAIGSTDLTLSTSAMWTSGTWVGDNAADGDGTDDFGSATQLGTFGSSMDTDFALATTIQTTDTNAYLCGVINSGDSTEFRIDIGRNGSLPSDVLGVVISDSNGNSLYPYTDNAYNDGNKHRVVINKTGNTTSDVRIWIDGTDVSQSINRDQSFSNPSDFDVNWTTHALNNGGSVGTHLDVTIDDMIFADNSWTSTEIQDDFDRQPWS